MLSLCGECPQPRFISGPFKSNTFIMKQSIRKQALAWYIQGYDLQTIADHFRVSKNELKRILNNQ